MLRSKCCVRNVILDLFPHAGGWGLDGRGMWEEVVGASLWISVDFQWILLDFLHTDLNILTNFAHVGSGKDFWG